MIRPKSFCPGFLPVSLLLPCTFRKKGPRRESLGRRKESRIGGLAPLTFSLQISSHTDEGTCPHHCSPACLGGLIPEEGVA